MLYVCMYINIPSFVHSILCAYSSLVGVASEAVGVAVEDAKQKELFTQVSDLPNLNVYIHV